MKNPAMNASQKRNTSHPSVRIKREKYDELKKLADLSERSISKMIDDAIFDYLKTETVKINHLSGNKRCYECMDWFPEAALKKVNHGTLSIDINICGSCGGELNENWAEIKNS